MHVIRCSFNSGNQRQHNDDRTHVSTLNLHIQGIGEDCLETAVGLFPQTSFVSFPGNIMIYVYFCLCISLHLTFLHNKCSMFRLQYDRRTFQVIVKAEFGHVHLVYIIFWCWQGRIGSFLVGSKWIPVHGYCVGKLLDYVKFFPSLCGTAFGHFYLVLCECKQWKFPSWFVDLSGLKRLPLVLSREIDKTVTRSWDLITTSEENILF